MPPDGSITFGDLIGQLEHLEIACPKCERLGRYSVRRLALKHGRDGKITDWISTMTADCPRKQAGHFSDVCVATCPDLVRVVQRGPQGGGDDAE
jgi:hypothetical protein